MCDICHCKLEICVLKITFSIFGIMQKGMWEIGSSLLHVVFVEVFILFCDHGRGKQEVSMRYPWGYFSEFIFH